MRVALARPHFDSVPILRTVEATCLSMDLRPHPIWVDTGRLVGICKVHGHSISQQTGTLGKMNGESWFLVSPIQGSSSANEPRKHSPLGPGQQGSKREHGVLEMWRFTES